MNNAVEEFLVEINMHHSQIDYDELLYRFKKTIEDVRAGGEGSLLMLPTYLNLSNKPSVNFKAISIDAGGTNLRVALVNIDLYGNPIIEMIENYSMIEISKEGTSDAFFRNIANLILKYRDYSKYIAMSFAYPGYIDNTRDLFVERMAKEIIIDDIEGKSFRAGISKHLEANGCYDKKLTFINDSVASLIGAVSMMDFYHYGSCVGFILGTGTNVCYREKCTNMKKIIYEKNNVYDIINTESGVFDYLRGGYIDKKIDENSKVPNDHIFEKLISGRYLYQIVAETAIYAYEKGVINSEIDNTWTSGAKINEYLVNNYTDEDSLFIKDLCFNFMLRAAKLSAVSICSCVLASHKIGDRALIVVEGTTALKLNGFMDELNKEINKILLNGNNIEFVIKTADEVVLKGAAISAVL